MSNLFDDKTEGAFEEFLGLDDDTKAEIEAERIATRALTDQLEAEFRDRGLKFTQPFAGAVPVQAYGHLDGLRFYFRFRGNHGSLILGPYDGELEELYALRMNQDEERHRQNFEAKVAAGQADARDAWLYNRVHQPQAEDDPQFYPHIIQQRASKQGPDPDDHYAGWLPNDQLGDMFRALADSLQNIPESEWLDEGTRIWMEQGREAKQAYDKKRHAEFMRKFLAEQTAEYRERAFADMEAKAATNEEFAEVAELRREVREYQIAMMAEEAEQTEED